MTTTGRRRVALAGAALTAVLGAPVLGLALMPAYADGTPVPSEPPGGATCAPGVLTATCGQDKGGGSTTTGSGGTKSGTTSGTKSGTKPGTTSATTTTSNGSRGTAVTSLPRTGPSDALPYGLAGAALLVTGAVLVVSSRRTRS